MSQATYDRCQALTDDGERCSRPAQDGAFCYQHDEDDPTVDEESADESNDGESTDGSNDGESAEAQRTEEGQSAGSEDDESEPADEPAADEGDESESADEPAADEGDGAEAADSEIGEIRRTVQSTGSDVIGRELDGVVGMDRHDDGWQVIVEVVERSAVPDTQDIIGQYEIDLGSDNRVDGYRRIDRYRRGDTQRDEFIG